MNVSIKPLFWFGNLPAHALHMAIVVKSDVAFHLSICVKCEGVHHDTKIVDEYQWFHSHFQCCLILVQLWRPFMQENVIGR